MLYKRQVDMVKQHGTDRQRQVNMTDKGQVDMTNSMEHTDRERQVNMTDNGKVDMSKS